MLAGTTLIQWANSRRSRAHRRRDGEYELRPSWPMHIITSLCVPICLLPLAPFVAAPVPPTPSESALLLAIFSLLSAGTLLIVWSSYGHRISWSGREIRLRRWFLDDKVFSLADVTGVEDRPRWSEFRIHFADGRTLRVSKYLDGATELVQRAMSAAGTRD